MQGSGKKRIRVVINNPWTLSLPQGHKRKNWKVRRFVLRKDPAFLHYYDPSKVSAPGSLCNRVWGFQTLLSEHSKQLVPPPFSQHSYCNFHHVMSSLPQSRLPLTVWSPLSFITSLPTQWVFIILRGKTSFSFAEACRVAKKGEVGW